MYTTLMTDNFTMCVKKRNATFEEIDYDKIQRRLSRTASKLNININVTPLVIKILDQINDGISSDQIDDLCAEQAASLVTKNYEFNKLASGISISNHHKKTPNSILESYTLLYNYRDSNNLHCPIIRKEIFDIIKNNYELLEGLIDYNRDYLIDFFWI